MIKKIKSLKVSDNTFDTSNGPLHHVNITFSDGTEVYCNCKDNPPWYKEGDDVQVILKGAKTKGDKPVDKASIKRVDEQQGGGSGGGGYKAKGGGGSRGGNESFALSYSKDVAVSLIAIGELKKDDAFDFITEGFHKLLPLLSPSPPKKQEDPRWTAVMKIITDNSLQADIRKLDWGKKKCVEEYESAGKDEHTFADNVRRMANPAPPESDAPEDFDEYEDDIPF